MKHFGSFVLALLLGLLLARFTARAQSVGIGTTTPDAKAALDIRATDKGLLVPRLSATQRTDIAAPPQGLMVYQTDGTAGGGIGTGFWYFGGAPAVWVFINPAGGGADNLGNGIATTAVNLQGNALVGTGASIGGVGVGVRADGGLNLGQNGAGNNVLVGYQAGQRLTPDASGVLGSNNQFSGYQSGQASTTGSFNQFSGHQAGFSTTAGRDNQFSGYQSGYRNTTGSRNLFSGYQAGFGNTTGTENQFTGSTSGGSNTTGSRNQFSGFESGLSNTTGLENQFSGYQAGYENTTGSRNQFGGYTSGYNTTTGIENLFFGYASGFRNTTGERNQFCGYESGYANTTGSFNVFSGRLSGRANTTGSQNQFSGNVSGYRNTTGSDNTFSGNASGFDNTSGSSNWAFGAYAGPATGNLTNAGALGTGALVSQSNSLALGGTGSLAVRVGIGTGAPVERLHVYGSGPTILRLQSSGGFGPAGVEFWSDPQGSANEWRPAFIRSADGNSAGGFVGNLVFYTNGAGFANRTAAVEQMRVRNGGVDVSGNLFVVGDGRISNLVASGTVVANRFLTSSDQRLKTAIRPLTGALALVQALHGHRYRWNALGVARGGTAGREQVGLLAQELVRVLPELVSTGPDGYQAVNYAQLAPVLIEAIKEQQQQVETLKSQVAALQVHAAADHDSLLRLQARVARLPGESTVAQGVRVLR